MVKETSLNESESAWQIIEWLGWKFRIVTVYKVITCLCENLLTFICHILEKQEEKDMSLSIFSLIKITG